MHTLRSTATGVALALAALVAGCGSDAPPPTCSGSSCACDPGMTCAIGDSPCADASCTLSCPLDASCSGTCGESCSISCVGSSCDVLLGASGSVTCAAGATCTVACTGACAVSCSDDSTCQLQCAGDAASTAVVGSAQCT